MSPRGLLVLSFAYLLCACESAAPVASTPAGPTSSTVDVVARVNGDEITLSEVRRLCEEVGLSPELALSRLVDERLLSQYAAASGYAALKRTQLEVKRARVRALLTQLEKEAGQGEPKSRFQELLTRLTSQTQPRYDEPAILEALEDDAVLGAGT